MRVVSGTSIAPTTTGRWARSRRSAWRSPAVEIRCSRCSWLGARSRSCIQTSRGMRCGSRQASVSSHSTCRRASRARRLAVRPRASPRSSATTFTIVPIEDAFDRELEATRAMLGEGGPPPTPLTEQNVQARIRGTRMWNWVNTSCALFPADRQHEREGAGLHDGRRRSGGRVQRDRPPAQDGRHRADRATRASVRVRGAEKFARLLVRSIYKWVQSPLAIHVGALDLDRERTL
jgi:hypothetical protein